MWTKLVKKLKNALPRSKKQTKICLECFKEYQTKSIRNIVIPDSHICDSCFNNFSIKMHRFNIDGINCLSLYDYDDYFKGRLFQFKGCFDIVLAKSFIETFINELRLIYYGRLVVPVPSNKQDDEKRGFNHVKEIFKYLGLNVVDCLYKNTTYKQSDQSFDKRINIHKVIEYIDVIDIKNKNILLVDDVITTGNTLKACVRILKNKGVKSIKILTLSSSTNLHIAKSNPIKKAIERIKKTNKVD